ILIIRKLHHYCQANSGIDTLMHYRYAYSIHGTGKRTAKTATTAIRLEYWRTLYKRCQSGEKKQSALDFCNSTWVNRFRLVSPVIKPQPKRYPEYPECFPYLPSDITQCPRRCNRC